MRKSATQYSGFNIDTVTVGKLSRKVAWRTIELLHCRPGHDLYIAVADNSLDHAANGVFGPFARRHQLGIAGQDRCTAELVFFFYKNRGSAHCAQAVCRSHDQYRFSHCLFS